MNIRLITLLCDGSHKNKERLDSVTDALKFLKSLRGFNEWNIDAQTLLLGCMLEICGEESENLRFSPQNDRFIRELLNEHEGVFFQDLLIAVERNRSHFISKDIGEESFDIVKRVGLDFETEEDPHPNMTTFEDEEDRV